MIEASLCESLNPSSLTQLRDEKCIISSNQRSSHMFWKRRCSPGYSTLATDVSWFSILKNSRCLIPTKKWRHCLATCHLSVMPSQRPCNGGTCWRLGFMVWMVSFSWMSATNAWGKLKSAGVETAMDFGPVKSWEADVSWRFVRNDCWRWCFFHVKSWSVGHWKCENSCLLFVSPRSLNNLWGDLLILVRECKRYIYI